MITFCGLFEQEKLKNELFIIKVCGQVYANMWPILLDLTEEESIQTLRHLEIEAYSSLISALRAQGNLDNEKRRILKETGAILNISNDRHKSEVRRATNDEKLNTIAYHVTGRLGSIEEWSLEGRRLIPLMPRDPPPSICQASADEASELATQINKELPPPCKTERKRPPPQPPAPVITERKSPTFRVPDVPKEEPKKRKSHNSAESTLSQHLLAPKVSKIQHLYRQASKPPPPPPPPPPLRPKEQYSDPTPLRPKEQYTDPIITEKYKPPFPPITPRMTQVQRPPVTTPTITQVQRPPVPTPTMTQVQRPPPPVPIPTPPKINIIQNITIPSPHSRLEDKPLREFSVNNTIPVSENQMPLSKPVVIKSNNFSRQSMTSVHHENEIIDPSKLSVTKKPVMSRHQKVIVVSNAPTMSTNSILQKTLSVPVNKLTKFSLDKFKILPSHQLPSTVTNSIANKNLVNNKPKLLTLKGSTTKKMIPLSQLQMLHPKSGIKVIPPRTFNNLDKYKKPVVVNNFTQEMISNANIVFSDIQFDDKRFVSPPYQSDIITIPLDSDDLNDQNESTDSNSSFIDVPDLPLEDTDEPIEKVKVEINGLIGNGMDYRSKIDDFRIAEVVEEGLEFENCEIISAESRNVDDNHIVGNESGVVEMDLEDCTFMDPQQSTGEILEEFEVIHTESAT